MTADKDKEKVATNIASFLDNKDDPATKQLAEYATNRIFTTCRKNSVEERVGFSDDVYYYPAAEDNASKPGVVLNNDITHFPVSTTSSSSTGKRSWNCTIS